MALTRLLICAAALALALPAVPAGAQELSGGVAAPASAAPEAESAQEQTPTTPEGEEQPPEEEPNGEQPPTEEPGPVDPPAEEPAPEADVGTGAEGTLPRTGTGIELAALTSIGLGLLLAGAALWPTSSWPRPRGCPSRSTPPR